VAVTSTKSVEDAIVTKLQGDISGLQIEPYPENPGEYQFLHPKGAILVQYVGSDYTEPRVLNTVTQVRAMRFMIVLLARNLHGHQGAYSYLDQIHTSLTGFTPTAATSKMYPVSEEFLDEANGVWMYRAVYAVRTTETE